MWTDRSTKLHEEKIGWLWKKKYGSQTLEGDLKIEMKFWLNDKRRRDLDNLIKTVLDGLNKVAYRDDSQIVALSARKLLGSERTEMVLEEKIYDYD